MPYRNFDDPYVYGPITQKEFNKLTVHHRLTYIGGQMYIGVSHPISKFASRLIEKPSEPDIIPEVIDDTTDTTVSTDTTQ